MSKIIFIITIVVILIIAIMGNVTEDCILAGGRVSIN